MKEKMTEELFLKKTATGFSEEEKYVLRQAFNLPLGVRPPAVPEVADQDEWARARYKALLMRALVKLGEVDGNIEEKPAKPTFPDENDPTMKKVLAIVDESGLGRSCLMGGAIILEGGITDIAKALSVPGLSEIILPIIEDLSKSIPDNLLPARRHLLAHIIGKLKSQGAVIKSQNLFHSATVDEIYELSFEGKDIGLFLMPL